MSDDADAMRGRWLALLRAEHKARYGEADRREAAEHLKNQLVEMAERLLGTHALPGPRRDSALAAELAAAEWTQVEELRARYDLSPAETTALTLAVNPKAALRLLREYSAHLR